METRTIKVDKKWDYRKRHELRDAEVVGVLGCDVIRQAVFEYDMRRGRIFVHDPKTYALPRGNWEPAIVRASPYLNVNIPNNADDFVFLLDTGATGLYVGPETPCMEAMFKNNDTLEKIAGMDSVQKVGGFGGTSLTIPGRLDWVKFCNQKVSNVRVNASLNPYDPFDEFDQGLIGCHLLEEFIVVFDLPNSRLGIMAHH